MSKPVDPKPVEPVNNFETTTRGRSGDADRGARRSHAKPVGRYDRRTHDTRLPPDGVARPVASSRHNAVVIAAVEDPWGNGKERLLATVNRNVDLLEMERSHDRISEAAYRTGRMIQAIFERLGGVGSSNWCGTSRMDPGYALELRMIRTLDSAETIQRMVERIARTIGTRDTRLLRRLLGDRMTFAQCANLEGKNGDRGSTYFGTRFRDALEDLARSWVGRGKAGQEPVDKHADAAETTLERQRASMAKGATAARREAEAVAEKAAAAATARRRNPRR